MRMHVAPQLAAADIPFEFVELAFVYLEAAEELSSFIKSKSWSPSFRRGQVLLFLTFHATELFLKGCILKAKPSSPINGHSLEQLGKTFKGLYTALEFEVPFGVEPLPPNPEVVAMAAKSERTAHERLRYPIDTSGNPWGGVQSFHPELFFVSLEKLRADLKAVRHAVFESTDG